MRPVAAPDTVTSRQQMDQRKMVGNKIILAEQLLQTKILVVADHTKTDNLTLLSICGNEPLRKKYDTFCLITFMRHFVALMTSSRLTSIVCKKIIDGLIHTPNTAKVQDTFGYVF